MSRRKQAKPQRHLRHHESSEGAEGENPGGTGSGQDASPRRRHRGPDGRSPKSPRPESDDSSAGESAPPAESDGWDRAMEVEEAREGRAPGPPDIPETLPGTNVTLEVLGGTRVAVAQLARGSGGRPGGRRAVPAILERLLALRRQQVRQLRLIEQIRSQVATMSRETSDDPASAAAQARPPPPAGKAPSAGPASRPNLPSLASASSSEDSDRSLSAGGRVSALMLCRSRGDLPHSPGSPPGGAVSPRPFAGVAATTTAKRRKGKAGGAPRLESDEPFFKHKCRFCAKVFGSDSALQIHLRSHTGERPFKCNICGNRFSTKGNLKVHFQRHRDKYPQVEMNPHPVPEYLDQVPTASGIPYGMTAPSERALSSHPESEPPPAAQREGAPCPPSRPAVTGTGGRAAVADAPVTPASPAPPDVESGDITPGGPWDSERSSETSKLRRLVENIDKRMSDAACRRDLGCAVKMHEGLHAGERPFEYEACGRASVTEGDLGTQAGVCQEKPPVRVQHRCPVCQKSFANAPVLRRHIGTHALGQIRDSAAAHAFGETEARGRKTSDSPGSHHLAHDFSIDGEEEEEEEEEGQALENVESPPQSLPENWASKLCSYKDTFLVDVDQIQIECSLTEKEMEILGTTSPPATPPPSPAKSAQAFSASAKEEDLGQPPAFATPGSKGTPRPPSSGSRKAIKTEADGHAEAYGSDSSAAYPSVAGRGAAAPPGRPPPPRRAARQHNCGACRKNFSSASALQIHERTHTGEKPFVCSVCGRAFTTKGNLKVHMGTHMWSNAPARRGRRLSVDHPVALLGSEAVKFDLAARAVRVDAGFWSRYACAIAGGLAMKNNEISVIQNRGATPLRSIAGGTDFANGVVRTMSSLSKNSVELGNNGHFSMLIDDNK